MSTPSPTTRALGLRCRELRKLRDLSQMDMVREFGWSLSHYQSIERGSLDARLSTLKRLAENFGVSLSDLVAPL